MDLKDKLKLFRSRFCGRQDVYGAQWEVVSREDQQVRRGYAPVCGNIWKDFCHLKLKDGIPCSKCEARQWAPVTDESVYKHILGQEAQLNYMLLQDGSINYGAMDFDMKEGKESQGYGFDEVKKAADLLSSYGIKFGIARSTGKGYHVYIFFDKPYSATKFRSFTLEFYARVGFMAYVHQGIKPLPEFFPKQGYVGRDGIGNGIKPPMIETRFEKCRNGWIDSFDNFIGQDLLAQGRIDAQWEFFANIPQQSTELFDQLLVEKEIPLLEEFAPGESRSGTPRSIYDRSKHNSKWQQPLSGSIEKVLEGCHAYRRIRDKVLAGKELGHDEGFALYHIAMHTLDGLDWFKTHVKNWGKNERDNRQLEQSLEKNYLPWTCRTLQDKGVCKAGTQCFEKRPPREIVDGSEVVRDDLPKDKWPEPSPIRYAHGKGEDYLLKLKADLLEVKKAPVESRYDGVKNLALRAQVFDEAQQKDFKAFVRGEKVIKSNEISRIFNEASDEFEMEFKRKIETREDAVTKDNNQYLKDDYGYIYVKPGKEGKTKDVKLCSVDIIIKEKRYYYDNDRDAEASEQTQSILYSGIVRAPGIERKFTITNEDWYDNQKFLVYFGGLFSTGFSPLRANIEYIRQAVDGFSERLGVEEKTIYTVQGYSGDTYRMPSCLIDATGIKPNTTQHVDLSSKETRGIDFQILPQSEYLEVLMHLKTEFLTTWPEYWTYIGLAQTFYPAVMGPMGWSKKPTLFYEGLTGSGKSELTHALQYFWGDFPALANFMSSPKGIRDLGYHFKDACVVVDDFKNLSREQTAAVRETILHAYDGAVDHKMKRDGTARPAKSARGIYMMSGEEFITNDAAVIARTLLVVTNKHNTRSTQEKYSKVLKMRKYYNGITPLFIQWFLMQDRNAVTNLVQNIKEKLRDGHDTAQNIERITNNLAYNHVLWRMITKFFIDYNVATAIEKETMDAKHWGFILDLRDSMVDRCTNEQSSEAFLRLLNQMIGSSEVSIDNLDKGYHINKTLVGFVPKNVKGVVYLFPKIVFKTVMEYANKAATIYGTEKAIARQLIDQGVMVPGEAEYTTVARYNGMTTRVWAIKLEALGIAPESSCEQAKDNVVDISNRFPQRGFPEKTNELIEPPLAIDDHGLI